MKKNKKRIKIACDFMNRCRKEHKKDIDYKKLLDAHKRIAIMLIRGKSVKEIYNMKNYIMYVSDAHWLSERIGTKDYAKI